MENDICLPNTATYDDNLCTISGSISEGIVSNTASSKKLRVEAFRRQTDKDVGFTPVKVKNSCKLQSDLTVNDFCINSNPKKNFEGEYSFKKASSLQNLRTSSAPISCCGAAFCAYRVSDSGLRMLSNTSLC